MGSVDERYAEYDRDQTEMEEQLGSMLRSKRAIELTQKFSESTPEVVKVTVEGIVVELDRDHVHELLKDDFKGKMQKLNTLHCKDI